MKNYIDPIVAAADNYRLLSQEGNVRVIEMRLEPGQIDNEHSHPSETVYFINGGKLRIHVGNNEPMEAEIPDGHVMHHGPWTHRVENIGKNTVLAIIFEL
ncbi:MAG: cupin domain-containing protein, partial [Owenweeksia sp.]